MFQLFKEVFPLKKIKAFLLSLEKGELTAEQFKEKFSEYLDSNDRS